MNRFRFAFVPVALFSAAAFLPFSAAHAQKGAKPAAKPTQASVAAASKSFETVEAVDAKVKAATDAKDLTKAKKLVDKTGTFTGTVDQIFEPKGNHLVVLNFDRNFRLAVSAVVRSEHFSKFPSLKTLVGKKVLVSGKVEDYNGRTEVVLEQLSDIKIIK